MARLTTTKTTYDKRKRLVDLFLFFLLSIPAVVIIIFVATWIIFASPGNPFFFQKRYGLNGKTFTLYKLRTMRQNRSLILEKAEETYFTTVGDDRIIYGGHFIRQLRLDEIPQFLNVFLGNMSFVGPRPEQSTLAKAYSNTIKGYKNRHSVLPGITGLAQIKSGYADDLNTTKKKLKYDLFYTKKKSLRFDLWICINTLAIIISKKGAR